MTLKALGLILALALTPEALFAASQNRLELADLCQGAKSSLLIHLPRFDDGLLQSAAAAALSRGAKVRLILSRREKSSRLAAASLKALGMQIRWAPGCRSRFIAADGARLALGNFDGEAATLEAQETGLAVIEDNALAQDFKARFEKEWQALPETLPSVTTLKDELEALPDPRENEPRVRIKRRRN